MWIPAGISTITERLKAPVDTYNDLPIVDNSENDIRITKDTDKAYTWNKSTPTGLLTDWKLMDDAALWDNIIGKPSSSVVDIDDAVTKKHAQNTDKYLTTDISSTLYVDGNRTDSYTANGSITKPFKTIQSAIDSVSDAGENKRYVISIVGGKTYEEQVTLKSHVYLKSDKTVILKNTSGSTVIAGGSGSVSYRIEKMIIICDSDVETHAAIDVSGTGNISLQEVSALGNNTVNPASPTGAEGLRVTSGTVVGSNSSFQGWNWALNMSGGFASLDICNFTGWGNDVQRTGGTLQLGMSKFTYGGVVGDFSFKYNASVVGNDSSIPGDTIKDALEALDALSGAGLPTLVTPEYIGQIYRDTSNNKTYVAKSLAQGDWELLLGGNFSLTFYVDPNGNDTTGDGSVNKPFLTIGKAISEIPVGEEVAIIVNSGWYVESSLVLNGENVTIIGRGQSNTFINVQNATTLSISGTTTAQFFNLAFYCESTNSSHYIVDCNASNTEVKFYRCSFQDYGGSPQCNGIKIRGNPQQIDFHDSWVYLNGTGLPIEISGSCQKISLHIFAAFTGLNHACVIKDSASVHATECKFWSWEGSSLTYNALRHEGSGVVTLNLSDLEADSSNDVCELTGTGRIDYRTGKVFPTTGLREFNVGASAEIKLGLIDSDCTKISGAGTKSRLYDACLIGNDSTVSGATVKDALETLESDLGDINASDVGVSVLGTPTYTNLQEYLNNTLSAGFISGGILSDNLDETVAITAGTGFIKTTDSPIGTTLSFDWSADASIALTDDALNYIYVDYNAGTPIIGATIDFTSLDQHTQFVVGMVAKRGTEIELLQSSGVKLSDFAINSWHRLEHRGIERLSGAQIAETGIRKLTVTSGIYYKNFNEFINSAIDTSQSAPDTFRNVFRDGIGGWTYQTGQTTFTNSLYDDNDGTPSDVGGGKYAVLWVYQCLEGDIYIQYGQSGTYNLSQAQASEVPTPPNYLASFAYLIGKIIILKNSTNATEINNSNGHLFVPTTPADHSELTALQGGQAGEYYHLTSAQHSSIADGIISTEDGDWKKITEMQYNPVSGEIRVLYET